MTQTSKKTSKRAETMPICNKLERERLTCHNGFTVTIAFITHNGAASPEGDEHPPPSPGYSNHNDIFQEHAYKYVPSPLFSLSHENDLQFRHGGGGEAGSYEQGRQKQLQAQVNERDSLEEWWACRHCFPSLPFPRASPQKERGARLLTPEARQTSPSGRSSRRLLRPQQANGQERVRAEGEGGGKGQSTYSSYSFFTSSIFFHYQETLFTYSDGNTNF